MFETRSRNHCCRGKATNIKYSEYVSVALFIQHVTRMRRNYHLWPLALPYVFTYLVNGTIYGKIN
jgi:hypothetical protein